MKLLKVALFACMTSVLGAAGGIWGLENDRERVWIVCVKLHRELQNGGVAGCPVEILIDIDHIGRVDWIVRRAIRDRDVPRLAVSPDQGQVLVSQPHVSPPR